MTPLFVRLKYTEEETGDTKVSVEINDNGKILENTICFIDTKIIVDLTSRAIFKDAMAKILERFIASQKGTPTNLRPPSFNPESSN